MSETTTERKKFTVDRKTWARGSGRLNRLLMEDGTRCCLGFVCSQSGVGDDELRYRLFPSDVVRFHKQRFDLGFMISEIEGEVANLNWIVQATTINDGDLTEAEREQRLVALFDKQGMDIEFIN